MLCWIAPEVLVVCLSTTTTTKTNIIQISISCKYHIHISSGILWWFSKEIASMSIDEIPVVRLFLSSV